MTSRKRSALAKQTAAFKAGLGGMDDAFAREEQRHSKLEQEKDASIRRKACESKNRYSSRFEAEAAIAACAEYETKQLHIYRCHYCNGWHLTSKKQQN